MGFTVTAGFPLSWAGFEIGDGFKFTPIANWYIGLGVDILVLVLLFRLFREKIDNSLAIRSLFNIAWWVSVVTIILLSPLAFVPPVGWATLYLVTQPVGIMGHFLIDVMHVPQTWLVGEGDKMDTVARITYLAYIFGFWGLYWLVRGLRKSFKGTLIKLLAYLGVAAILLALISIILSLVTG